MGGSTIFRCVASVALAAAVSAAPSVKRSDRQPQPRLFSGAIPDLLRRRICTGDPATRLARLGLPSCSCRKIAPGPNPRSDHRWQWGVLDSQVSFQSKTGSEVHAEIAASRLVWALGYFVEEHYFVGNETITGVSGMGRRTSYALGPDGRFSAARFERRQPDVSNEGRWDLDDNPFAGSRELSGLKILAMLVNNWDARLGNTAIRRMVGPSGLEDRYLLSDLGTAFGRMPGGCDRTDALERRGLSDRLVHSRAGRRPPRVLSWPRWRAAVVSPARACTLVIVPRVAAHPRADTSSVPGVRRRLCRD